MRIAGLQKLTLLDFPGNTACTVFTAGCNFRCPFCHNSSLVVNPTFSDEISEEEFFSFLEKRVGILDGVAITGGEPLLQPDIADFMRKVRELGFKVKLDTNGSFPEKLRDIVNEGLADYIAVDIKDSPKRYAEAIGRLGYDPERVFESVNFLRESGIPHEFRTTVVSELHTASDIEEIAKIIAGNENYYLQNFVDSGELISQNMHGVTPEKMHEFLEIARKYVPSAQIRGL